MSGGGNKNNDDDEGWGSKFLKVASAAAATAALAGGLYALLSSSSSSEQQPPFESHTRRVIKDRDDEYDHDDIPSYQIRWKKPEVGWVKLNVDGSCDHISNPRSAGCGGVLRDASGNWLLGFSQKLDPSCEVDDTEIAAILKGLELASDMNIKWLVVESDNESVVSIVENGTRPNHPQYSSIRRLRSHPKWEVKVVHIRREANQVADRLANNARALPDEFLRKYYYPPANYVRLVEEDARLG
ncbi:hypothetical protein RIF29_16122 [Crotalaria pallida]|uniref:RNase H type-1 domain-containing protein n=1 Tax=Crotalaria pallida TaxID=3830 RepID=A0AAN9FGP1_CROPI